MEANDHRSETWAAYQADAPGWVERTVPQRTGDAVSLRAQAVGTVVDLGCGPAWHLPDLSPSIGLDRSLAMLGEADPAGRGRLINGDLSRLPFRRGSLGGAWASRSLVHLPRKEVPPALAELHNALAVDAPAKLWLFEGDEEAIVHTGDQLPGRTFSFWTPELLERTLCGAGFEIDDLHRWQSAAGHGQIMASIRRAWTLPDYVGPDMRLLICGLNPSPSSADSGVGFFKAGNRFWPAALQAGLATQDRNPFDLLRRHRIGMTDMVKRPTRRADELSAAEYRAGFARVSALVDWLQPAAICMVGLAGWRVAVNRKAGRGWQPETIADRPVYVMPSTSGLNAHDTLDTLAEHLRTAASGPSPAR